MKVEDDLVMFAKHHDRRLYKHFKTCMDLQTDLATLIKAMVGSITVGTIQCLMFVNRAIL